MLGAPEMDIIFQIGSQESRAEGEILLSQPARQAAFDAGKDMFGSLDFKCSSKLLIFFS